MDRRVSEQGTVKIKKKNLITYLMVIVLIAILTAFGIFYAKNREKNKSLANIKQAHNNNYSCSLVFEGSQNKIQPGNTATFEIKASDIKAEDGIIMLEGYLDYDYNTFECSVENIEDGKWYKVSMLEEYLTMARNDLLPSSENQTIGKLVIKAREQAKKGSYKITLKNPIFIIENGKDFSIKDISTIIEIN